MISKQQLVWLILESPSKNSIFTDRIDLLNTDVSFLVGIDSLDKYKCMWTMRKQIGMWGGKHENPSHLQKRLYFFGMLKI